MEIDPIFARHARILQAADGLEALVEGERPHEVDGLAHRRWAFTREMMLHCAQTSDLLAELAVDRRPEAAALAQLAIERTQKCAEFFHAHTDRWKGLPSAEEWDSYRVAIRRLTRRIRGLIDGEARQIIPLLPVQPSGTPARSIRHSFVEDAWEVRRKIFDESERPIH